MEVTPQREVNHSPLEQMIDNTGSVVPLAAEMVSVILECGASDMEARAALKIVEAVLITPPIAYRAEGFRPSDPAT
jgi:hypothetical protein